MPKTTMAIATLRDVWPVVSELHAAPDAVLDEIRRLYRALKTAPRDQHAALEAQIRAVADEYRRATDEPPLFLHRPV